MGVRVPYLRYPDGPCLCEYFSVMHNHAYEVTNEGIFHNVNSPSMGSVPLAELVNLGFQWVVGREGIRITALSIRK